MTEQTTMVISKDVAQRLKRLKRETFFVSNGMIFAKLLERMNDQQLLALIEEVRQERDFVKYNYIKPQTDTRPQQYIYPEPASQ